MVKVLPVAWFARRHRAIWPRIQRRAHVRVKTRYFEKFKINISTLRIQTKLSTRKRFNTRSILLTLPVSKF
jgi:hypothetical protein